MSRQLETITEDGEIVSVSDGLGDTAMIGALARAEIDTLIATARTYPRQLTVVQKKMTDLATMDEEAADEAIYSVPRDGKVIEGPSIRFAEMAVQCYGNARVAARTTMVDRKEMFVEAEGIFLDAETNVATLARVRRRISNKRGRVFSDDMITTTSNAAQSIARRNAILAGIPKAIWRKPFAAARQVVMGDIKTLANRRGEALAAMQRFGLTAEQVFALLGVAGEEEIDQDKLVTLRSTYRHLRDGEITVEQLLKGEEAAGHAVIADPLNDDGPAPKPAPADAAQGKPADDFKDSDPAGRDHPDTAAKGGGTAAPASTPTPEPEKAASGDAAGEAAPTAGAGDDADQGEPPTAAYAAGREARRKGISGRAVPEEFAADETASADWVAGWKDENAAQKAGGSR